MCIMKVMLDYDNGKLKFLPDQFKLLRSKKPQKNWIPIEGHPELFIDEIADGKLSIVKGDEVFSIDCTGA